MFESLKNLFKKPNEQPQSKTMVVSAEIYRETLKRYYQKYENNVFQEDKLLILHNYTGYSIEQIRRDLKEIRKELGYVTIKGQNVKAKQSTISNEEYLLLLEELYLKYGNNAFQYLKSIEEKTYYDMESIKRDLRRVRDRVNKEALEEYASKRQMLNKNTDDTVRNEQEIKSDVGDITSQEQYFNYLRQLYSFFGNDAFQRLYEVQEKTGYAIDIIKHDLKRIRKEEYTSQLEELYAQYGNSAKKHIKEIQKKTGYQRMTIIEDLKKIGAKMESKNSDSSVSKNATKKENVDNKKQIYNNVNTASKKSRIIDATTIFNKVKKIPVKFDYYTDVYGNHDEIVNICSAFITDVNVLSAVSDEVIMNLEKNIQRKRIRNSVKTNHDKNMELNILFDMYRYSYLLNTIVVLEDYKNDIIKVDFQKYWSLIHEDCMRRLSNIDLEKKYNPAINVVLKKYENNYRTLKMKLLSQISTRENDYIIATLMTNAMSVILNLMFNGITMKVSNNSSSEEVLEIIKKYPSKDVCMFIDTYVLNLATLRITAYANNGGLSGLR